MKIFELFSIPNQAFAIGANAMIGIALAATKYGISADPSGRKRASTSAAAIPPETPIDEAPERLGERVPARRPEDAALIPERRRDLARLGQQELLDPECLDGELPADEPEHEDQQRREPLGQEAANPTHGISLASCDSRRSSRTSVASSKKRVSSRVSFVRG